MTNKEVAILTFQSSNNYGALLQCYALSKTIERQGHNVSIINIQKEYIKDFEGLTFLNKQKLFIKKRFTNYIFQREFDVFRTRFLKNKFTKPIKTVGDLNEYSNKYDAIVVGSDQVWRYAYTKSTLKSYFLDFASDQTTKISYAASFGLDYFEGNNKIEKEVKGLIKRFEAVSVREDKGVDICREKFDLEATHVLDPVFLLSNTDYIKLIDKKEPEEDNYIAFYFLNPDKFRKNLVLKTMSYRGINRERNIYTNLKFSFRKPSFPLSKYKFKSFSKWLNTLKNADFMITDSFHGLAFSIIFNKQFICIANKARGASRMESVLNLLGLQDRLLYEGQNDFNVEELKQIDYNLVNAKLLENKNKSLNFLKLALKK